MISDVELKKVFNDHPQAIINDMISKHALKGRLREVLIDHIMDNMEDPKWQEYLWLLMLPRRLSGGMPESCGLVKY